MSSAFGEALAAGDTAAIRSTAKADLHSHLYFAASVADVERWLGHAVERPPPRMEGLDGMREYARRAINPYIDNWTAFEFVAGAAVRHAQNDGVVLLETSIDIWAVRHHPEGLRGVVAFAASVGIAVSRARSTFGRKWDFRARSYQRIQLMSSLSEAIETRRLSVNRHVRP